MQLLNYLGLKLVDIGTDDETSTLWLEFTGGHMIHVKRDGINQAIILTKPNISSSELDNRREEIKKARAEARAKQVSKATNAAPPKKPTKASKKKAED